MLASNSKGASTQVIGVLGAAVVVSIILIIAGMALTGNGKSDPNSNNPAQSNDTSATVPDGSDTDPRPPEQNRESLDELLKVDFSFSPDNPDTGERIRFSPDIRTDGTVEGYLWTFDQGDQSNQRRPTHTYSEPGTYTVELTVVTEGGIRRSSTGTIQVGDRSSSSLEANFSFSPRNPTVSQEITFKGSATAPDISYSWNLNGTGFRKGASQETFSYSIPGNKTVKLKVVDESGNQEIVEKQIQVGEYNRPPIPEIDHRPEEPKAKYITYLDASDSRDEDGRIVRYLWDIDSDGKFGENTAEKGMETQNRFETTGEHRVGLRVVDDDGANSTLYDEIYLQPDYPVASFSIPENPRPGEILFDASNSTDNGQIEEYLWDKDGDSEFEHNGQKVRISLQAGTHEITLKVRDNNNITATSTETFEVKENQAPVLELNYTPSNPITDDYIEFNASGSSDPDGSIEKIQWDFNGDGEYEKTGKISEHRFSSAGTKSIGINITDNEGLKKHYTRDVRISDRAIEVVLYLNESRDITEQEYTDFLKNDFRSQFRSVTGLRIGIDIIEVNQYDSDTLCMTQANFEDNIQPPDADVAICVESGGSGFWGSRNNVVDHGLAEDELGTKRNTNLFMQSFLFFLGNQGLTYPSEMPKKWIDGNLMSGTLEDPDFSDIQRDIAEYNILQIYRKGRKSIYYAQSPSDPPSYRKHRLQDSAKIQLEFNSDYTCDIDEIMRYDTRDLDERQTENQRITIEGSQFTRPQGLKLSCGQNTYWAIFPTMDRCFTENGYSPASTCTLSCTQNNDWCTYESHE